jgi:uncharacterized protein YjaZ
MNTFTLLIANAGGNLNNNKGVIKNGFNRAVITAQTLIDLDKVDVVCTNDPYQVIPEMGMSGYTPNRNLVYLYVDGSKKLNEDEIFYTLCHEFMHAKRYDGPSYGTTLFDSIIFEGLGVAIEQEVSNTKGSFLSTFVDQKDNDKLLKNIESHFDDEDFNRFYWFVQESDDLPRWTGYRVGYYIVSEYLKKTNKKASDLALEDPSIFRDYARDDLG